jgi:hypothetical protein
MEPVFRGMFLYVSVLLMRLFLTLTTVSLLAYLIIEVFTLQHSVNVLLLSAFGLRNAVDFFVVFKTMLISFVVSSALTLIALILFMHS